MIISGGVNIYPQEAENLLITHPKVLDCAVFGVPDDEMGEQVKAVVQPLDWDDGRTRARTRAPGVLPRRPGPLQVPAFDRLRASSFPVTRRASSTSASSRIATGVTGRAGSCDGAARRSGPRWPTTAWPRSPWLGPRPATASTCSWLKSSTRSPRRGRSTGGCGPCSPGRGRRTSASAATSSRFAGARDDLPAHLTDVTTYLHAAISRLIRLDAPGGRRRAGQRGRGRASAWPSPADLVLAGASSRFVLAYTAIGLTPGRFRHLGAPPRSSGCAEPSTSRSPTVGSAREEAVAEGIATRVVADDELADEALALARTLGGGTHRAPSAPPSACCATPSAPTSRPSWLSRPQSLAAAAGIGRRRARASPRSSPSGRPSSRRRSGGRTGRWAR